MFEECKLEGDFKLSSGLKSNVFYDFDLLTPKQVLEYVDKLCSAINEHANVRKFDYVAAPAIGGIIPGFLVAGEFGVPLVIVEKDGTIRGVKNGAVTTGVPRTFLIVDDVTASYKTGKRIAELLSPDKPVGIASYIFRGKKATQGTVYLEQKEVEK